MKNRIKKMFIWVVCMVILISTTIEPIDLFAKEGISLLHDGNEVDDVVSFDSGSKYSLEVSGGSENSKYQWQVLNKYSSDEQWVDVAEQNQSKIELSYAMLKEQLNDGKTKIRVCIENTKGTEEYKTIDIQIEENDSKLNKIEKNETKNLSEDTSANKSKKNTKKEKSAEASVMNTEPSAQTVDDEYVTVVINYTYDFGVKAFDSYVATLIKGSEFSTSVTSPFITGYHPVMVNSDGTDEDALSVAIDYSEGVNENVEYNVIYKPSLVEYRVKYFFQDINDDNYFENTSEEITDRGYTNSLPNEEYFGKNFDGFSPLSTDADFISSDGSSEYDVYYNRNYYLINFMLDGGYGVDPIYARYDKSFVVNTPIKQGYVFKGWDLLNSNGEGDGLPDELPTNIPAESRNYKALWGVMDASYTVVYWKENANDDGYSYWGSDVRTEASGQTVSGSDDVKERDFAKKVVQEAVPAKNGFSAIREYYEYEYFSFDHADSNVVVEGDGSSIVNVYYKRNVYELRFYYARKNGNKYNIASSTTSGNLTNNSWYTVNSLPTFVDDTLKSNQETISGYTYYYYSLNAKYGADISKEWATKLCNSSGSYNLINWGPNDGCKYRTVNGVNASIVGAYSTMSSELILDPSNSVGNKLLAWWTNSWQVKDQTYNIYFEILDGETGDVTYNGKSYKLHETLVFPSVYNTYWTRFDPILYPGMESINSYGIECDYNNPAHEKHDFYYDRNRYTLTYFNHNSSSNTPNTQTLMYGESISNYKIDDMTNYYPDSLESNAYVFKGWFEDPLFVSPVDWDSWTMNEGMTVYAKWEYVVHKVNVYANYEDAENGTNLYGEYDISHGSAVNPGPDFVEPTRDGYTFAGWFYMKNGEKQAFSLYDMPVTKDITVFADWESTVVTDYSVNYVFIDKDGVSHEIAESTKGRMFAGSTKTFKAKTGNGLLEEYRTHYYPKNNSHSIIMDTDAKNNTYTFEYLYLENVPYTVKYVDKISGMVLSEDKYVADNEAAVVTEKFKYIKGYVPDSFYKKLILSANEKENVITFYYVPDDAHAYYAVKYYTENTETSGYDEYMIIEGVGDIGSEAVAETIDISGFTLNTEKSVMRGTISGNGLELSLYYDKNSYEYTVNYLEYGTNKKLRESDVISDYFGKTITANAKEITDYEIVGESKKSITIVDDVSRNVINFYYKTAEVLIQYKVVADPEIKDVCSLSLSQEILSSSANLRGSKPLVLDGSCTFVGWYYDEACTKPVKQEYVSDNDTLTPKYESAVYYAKFNKIALLPSTGADTALLLTLLGVLGIAGYGICISLKHRKRR